MKLYAKTTSDRASKGQGGNEFLSIDLSMGTAKNSKIIAKVMLDKSGFIYLRNAQGIEKECYTVQGDDIVRVTDINKLKGKKQKTASDNPFKTWNKNLHINGVKI